MIARNRIEKMAEETLTLAVEFGGELASGETLTAAGAIAWTPSGLSSSAPTISGTQIKFAVIGGTDGVSYEFTLTGVSTSGGNTLGAQGWLDIVG